MRKFFILNLVILSSFQFTHAQLRISMVGGGHSASVNESNDLPDWNNLKNKYSSRTGVHFGFLSDLQLGYQSKFYFQPGIIFYNKGRSFFNTYDTAVNDYFSINRDQFVNYIEAPLNLVFKQPIGTKSKIFFGGGPYLSFFYNGKEKSETYLKTGSYVTEESTDLPVGNAPGKYKTMDLGVNGIAGIEFSSFYISAVYSRGITDFYRASAYYGEFKHQIIGGRIGVYIGKPVILQPKVKDRDKDGVPDEDDHCEDQPGPELTKGCPDKDGDGIADHLDQCPDLKGTVVNKGCPVKDSDGDGVDDDQDLCKNEPGPAKYQGCPIPDTDKDGVNDEEDKCINTPGLARYNGCPIPDRDNDGLNDEEDKCPDLPGPVNNKGCPAVQKEVEEKASYAAKRILFEFAKADLKEESFDVLNEIAGILKTDTSLKLIIEGHTSNDGSEDANMILSTDRANEVKKYLISKGILESRLTAIGYGPTRPLNDGNTKEEKALNRRVELKLHYD